MSSGHTRICIENNLTMDMMLLVQSSNCCPPSEHYTMRLLKAWENYFHLSNSKILIGVYPWILATTVMSMNNRCSRYENLNMLKYYHNILKFSYHRPSINVKIVSKRKLNWRLKQFTIFFATKQHLWCTIRRCTSFFSLSETTMSKITKFTTILISSTIISERFLMLKV